MKEFWNERFDTEEYIYGTTPNAYFKQHLDKEPKGKLLLPAEGEGRNALYAAINDWDVTAFDVSDKGRDKALKLAEENNVSLQYDLGNFLEDYDYADNSFDAVGLVYSHFTGELRSKFHRRIAQLIKPNGLVIVEAFCKQHLDIKREDPQNTSGPGEEGLLLSLAELKDEFKGFDIIEAKEEIIDLSAGIKHKGIGHVVHFVARKQ